MPKYRFRWEALPPDTLAEITDTLGLEGDPVTALRRGYGARPTTQFVRELWPQLRDGWLTRDDYLREWVVEQLRSARLGDPSLDDDMVYLRSCRNAETLRQIVLAAFHIAGDAGYYESADDDRPRPEGVAETPGDLEIWIGDDGVPRAQTRRPEHSRAGGTDIDLDALVASSWAAFADQVRDALPELGDEALIIGLPTPYDDADLEGVAPYLQFVIFDESWIWGELSSNAFLDERLQLSDAQQRHLERIGWLPPTYGPNDEPDEEGSPNFYLQAPLSEAATIAAKAVAAIVEVFDVPHPSFLEWGGTEPVPEDLADDEHADLRRRVDRALASVFDEPLVHDADGDIPIRAGSAMLFVRVGPDRPIVTLFSPLLVDCAGDALALERINRANHGLRFGRLTWSDGTLLASYDLWCDPFVPDTLLQAVRIMMELADDMDDRLRVQVGGRRFFEDTHSASPIAPDRAKGAMLTILHLAAGGTELTPEQAARICDHDRDIVLSLISDAERDTIAWRETAEDSDDPEEVAVARIEEAAAKATLSLLRAALRLIVLEDQ